jgi:hypothetical protein
MVGGDYFLQLVGRMRYTLYTEAKAACQTMLSRKRESNAKLAVRKAPLHHLLRDM